MKKYTIVLLILLFLDVITTIYLLEYVPNTMELNPLLSQFGNVVSAVIISHIFAALVVIALDIQSLRFKEKDRQKLDIFMTFVILFYVGVVSFNSINIVIGHIYYL